MEEIWKEVENYPGYEVSNLGRVKSLKGKTPYILEPEITSKGYCRVKLRDVNG